MDRREFVGLGTLYSFLLANPCGEWLPLQRREIEKGAKDPEAIPEPHFPDRLHLFVWRNWELANTGPMAQVLGTTPEKVLELGASMGLPNKPELSEDQLRRIYITVIRQNWHILPDEQILQLLGWNSREYQFHLKEDDFLWMKLGMVKPHCELLKYEEPSDEAKRRAAEIKRLVEGTLGSSVHEPGEPAFAFVRQLSHIKPFPIRNPRNKPAENEVDLSRGWSLITPAEESGIPPALAEQFQTYLHDAMSCEVSLARNEKGTPARAISFSLDPVLTRASSTFGVLVHPERIRVVASDLSGLHHAIYFLQERMEIREGPYLTYGSVQRQIRLNPRYVYSYFALYGDPLMEPDIDPFPDGLLHRLASIGVNGVWLQAVLRNLAPSKGFPEFGGGWEARVRNLNTLIKRAKDYGVKIYFYLNEPRSLPAEFFAGHPEVKGTHDPGNTDFFAMCTSTAEVRDWLREALAHLFAAAPGLGGIFCITASENLTNCYSHGHPEFCPRCSKRRGSEVIGQVIRTIRDGVRRSSATADVIAWDWGWGRDWVLNSAETAAVLPTLPKDVALLSVSEWDKQIDRGGHRTKVGEYSISVVGPGSRAVQNWSMARNRGMASFAKVQWSCTWEISAVPYIPVPSLILEHCENLVKAGIQGLMASWTVGGYPSPNFEVTKKFYFAPTPDRNRVLRDVAIRHYGEIAAPEIVEAWEIFGRAFIEYPMEGGGIVYRIPVQHGPSNLLRLQPTGYKASMMLFPYDDYKNWVGSYPVEVVHQQFEKMAALWELGVKKFRSALDRVPPGKRLSAVKDIGIAETCYLHFKSVANQILFYRLRSAYEQASPQARPALESRLAMVAREEIELASRLYAIARADSQIGFEASNHYYYRPLDLLEKVLNCHYVIDAIESSGKDGKVSQPELQPLRTRSRIL